MLDNAGTYTNTELLISTMDMLKVIFSSAITEFKWMSHFALNLKDFQADLLCHGRAMR